MHDGNRLTQALLFENVLRFFDQHYPDSQDESGIQNGPYTLSPFPNGKEKQVVWLCNTSARLGYCIANGSDSGELLMCLKFLE